ncbi:MAG: hypothetical protein H0V18_05795, partial [Pyrinomonadaceae bacterium]|nr:hypothetical protein [Pyrinomonadaceae bacterium]
MRRQVAHERGGPGLHRADEEEVRPAAQHARASLVVSEGAGHGLEHDRPAPCAPHGEGREADEIRDNTGRGRRRGLTPPACGPATNHSRVGQAGRKRKRVAEAGCGSDAEERQVEQRGAAREKQAAVEPLVTDLGDPDGDIGEVRQAAPLGYESQRTTR